MSIEDVLKGASIPAVVIGVGLAALAPLLLQGLSGGSRPAAKALLHKYFDAAEKLKGLSAEAQEQLKDLLAEVQAERQMRQASEAAAAADTSVEI